ncbi:MAG: transposase [Candidatus Latescibacterota bacterium]
MRQRAPPTAAAWYRARAPQHGYAQGRCGAVTCVQRWGSALNLNPHLHVLMPHGVWVTGPDGTPTFVAVAPPTDPDIQQVVERTAPLCYAARGFSLHAATRVAAAERERLEQLCRYVLRPPLAAARRRWLDPNALTCTLRTPWDEGTTHVSVSPHERRRPRPARGRPGADRAGAGTAPPSPGRRRRRGPMRLIAGLTDPDSLRTYLDGVGRDWRAPAHDPGPLAPRTPVRLRRLSRGTAAATPPAWVR